MSILSIYDDADDAPAPDDRAAVPVERVRESVAVRVQSTSLRSVARQVGMSPSGLEKFISGGSPYSRSREKLQEWWLREGSLPRSDVTTEGVEAALGALLRDLPPRRRGAAMASLVRSLGELYAAQGGPGPPWLAELSERWVAGRRVPRGARKERGKP